MSDVAEVVRLNDLNDVYARSGALSAGFHQP